MKKVIYIAMILFALNSVIAQSEKSDSLILNAPEDWRTEIIPFPLSFAPEISFEGIEDIRFAPGWAKKESPTFWTYAFVWHLDKDPALDARKIEITLEVYFDGLMKNVAANGKEVSEIPKTSCLFIEDPNNPSTYIGKIKVHDAFFVKDIITLKVMATVINCSEQNKFNTVFHISPKDFEDQVWEQLAQIRLKKLCEK